MSRTKRVRAIEYRIMNRQEARATGLTSLRTDHQLTDAPEVAALKCVDGAGQKLTAIGDAAHLRQLLKDGIASDPAGMDLDPRKFPVVITGWPRAS